MKNKTELSKAFSGFELLRDASGWAGNQARGAARGPAAPAARPHGSGGKQSDEPGLCTQQGGL